MRLTKKILFLSLLIGTPVFADGEYHKNTLIGGRAATMGGAYTAISDDASGAFYNPAGLAFAGSSSFSGSANTYTISDMKYEGAIGGEDWQRTSNNLKPNFFGVVQKNKNETYAFSYALTDAAVEHQDQIFKDLTDTVDPINLYVLNLHTEDSTYLIGPSYAKKVSDTFSWGTSFFYHYRVYRRAQSQLLRYVDGDDEASYSNNIKKEKGFKPKLGFMISPKDKWSVGVNLSKTLILTSLSDIQRNEKIKGVATYSFAQYKKTTRRKTPIELETGVAYFPSAFLLLSANIDYYAFTDDNDRDNVINLSLGSEYFLSEKHAIRGGVFSNRTNSQDPSSKTTNSEHVDMYGASLGYALFSQSTTITFGTIFSMGSGRAQIYDDSKAHIPVEKWNMDFVVAADYGF
jgi:long-chain fatty acid transport protein